MTSSGSGQAAARCLACGDGETRLVDGFAGLPRITSDCRPFDSGGELAVCGTCGAVQKYPDARWFGEIERIYADYEPYAQSGGDEQIVFDALSGHPRRRSDVLMERLLATGMLPSRGDALDVGCGNGATLSAMSSILTGWRLNGFELGDAALARLQRIPRFDRLHTGTLSDIGRRFDLVTMVHSLEHFPDPLAALTDVGALASGGALFVEVCNVDQNPFDVLVADHLMHFSPATLSTLMRRAGFQVIFEATDWVPKEISMLVKQGPADHEKPDAVPGPAVHERITGYVRWLRDVATLGAELARSARPLGIFGTSIAATWLAAQLGEAVSFFVDEDESRVGRIHLGRPILRPADVPAGAEVYLSLAPAVADHIVRRLAPLGIRFVLPPAAALQTGPGTSGATDQGRR